jgi:hypothetical protein
MRDAGGAADGARALGEQPMLVGTHETVPVDDRIDGTGYRMATADVTYPMPVNCKDIALQRLPANT